MPRFLKRILGEIPFRKESEMRDDLQRTRRVLVRTSAGFPEEQTNWTSSFFDPPQQVFGSTAMRDGISIAGSAERPILAPSIQDQTSYLAKQQRTRRRLSKKHGRPA